MFDRVLNTPLLVTIFSLPTETKVNVINVKQEGQPLVAGEKPITLLRFFFFFSEIFHLEPLSQELWYEKSPAAKSIFCCLK